MLHDKSILFFIMYRPVIIKANISKQVKLGYKLIIFGIHGGDFIDHFISNWSSNSYQPSAVHS